MQAPVSLSDAPETETPAVRSVLVVDDSRMQRRILSGSLSRWGYRVLDAASGEEALACCREQPVDLIISDWMMPGMSGPDFCRAFKELDRDSYGYFILLTSKRDKGEVAAGLDAGADDFLTKPVNPDELRARIHAGERVLQMEHALRHRNRIVSETLAELRGLYDALDRDLAQARGLQQSLIRERRRRLLGGEVSLLLHPAGHIGGDLVGFYPIGAHGVGVFALDVSGHGVSSALLTARLAGLLSGITPERNIALDRGADGRVVARPPAEVVARLNGLMLDEMTTDLYFTMALAEIDLATGRGALVQAGHPHPALQRRAGGVDFLGDGGLPVGLLANAWWREVAFEMAPGDRLLMVSDGVSECVGRDGAQLGARGIARILQHLSALRGASFHDALLSELRQFANARDFADDVSTALLERDITPVGPDPSGEN